MEEIVKLSVLPLDTWIEQGCFIETVDMAIRRLQSAEPASSAPIHLISEQWTYEFVMWILGGKGPRPQPLIVVETDVAAETSAKERCSERGEIK